MAAKRKPNLKVVKATDKPTKPKVAPQQTVAQAAASNDHRALLVAMRDRIASTISKPDCPPRDLASLTRRLQDIAKEIEVLDLRAKEDGADADDVAEDEALTAEAF